MFFHKRTAQGLHWPCRIRACLLCACLPQDVHMCSRDQSRPACAVTWWESDHSTPLLVIMGGFPIFTQKNLKVVALDLRSVPRSLLWGQSHSSQSLGEAVPSHVFEKLWNRASTLYHTQAWPPTRSPLWAQEVEAKGARTRLRTWKMAGRAGAHFEETWEGAKWWASTQMVEGQLWPDMKGSAEHGKWVIQAVFFFF